jgi:hypothetical protein
LTAAAGPLLRLLPAAACGAPESSGGSDGALADAAAEGAAAEGVGAAAGGAGPGWAAAAEALATEAGGVAALKGGGSKSRVLANSSRTAAGTEPISGTNSFPGTYSCLKKYV